MYILLSGNVKDSSLFNVISLLLIFVFVLVLAYFTAKLTAKLQGNPLNKRANIKIVETFRLGGNKFISIAKIGDNYYALGFGKDEITLIDKLDKDSINISEQPASTEKRSFKDIMKSINNEESQDNIDIK